VTRRIRIKMWAHQFRTSTMLTSRIDYRQKAQLSQGTHDILSLQR